MASKEFIDAAIAVTKVVPPAFVPSARQVDTYLRFEVQPEPHLRRWRSECVIGGTGFNTDSTVYNNLHVICSVC
jgi:hypothetical protein